MGLGFSEDVDLGVDADSEGAGEKGFLCEGPPMGDGRGPEAVEGENRSWREEVPGVAGFGVDLGVDADEAKPLMDDEGQRSGRRGGPWP